MRVFPGSERLRYLIPFADPSETIQYFREVADQCPNSILAFGDDGEKFGTWPDTKKHVYEDGWLTRFFDALVQNQDWLHTSTLSQAVDEQSALGQIYLPEGNVNQKVEPLCIPEETPTSPFKLFTKFFTIAKPRPLPLLCEALADAAL